MKEFKILTLIKTNFEINGKIQYYSEIALEKDCIGKGVKSCFVLHLKLKQIKWEKIKVAFQSTLWPQCKPIMKMDSACSNQQWTALSVHLTI